MPQIMTDSRVGLVVAVIAILAVAVRLYRQQAITLPGFVIACLATVAVGTGLIISLS